MDSSDRNVFALLLSLFGLSSTCVWGLLRFYERMKGLACVSYDTDSPAEVRGGRVHVQGGDIESHSETGASGLCSIRKTALFWIPFTCVATAITKNPAVLVIFGLDIKTRQKTWVHSCLVDGVFVQFASWLASMVFILWSCTNWTLKLLISVKCNANIKGRALRPHSHSWSSDDES